MRPAAPASFTKNIQIALTSVFFIENSFYSRRSSRDGRGVRAEKGGGKAREREVVRMHCLSLCQSVLQHYCESCCWYFCILQSLRGGAIGRHMCSSPVTNRTNSYDAYFSTPRMIEKNKFCRIFQKNK